MKAVILAAGKGTRMGDIGKIIPKPMLKVLGKTLLEHKIDTLPEEVKEIIFVIRHLGDQIQNHFGVEYGGRKVTYVEQPELNGTAGALFQAKHLLTKKFILMMGDDLYGREDMKKAIAHENSVLVRKAKGSVPGGKVTLDAKGNYDECVEDKKGEIIDGLVNTGFYVLTPDVFKYKLVAAQPGSVEFGLPQTIAVMAKDIPVKVVMADFWLNITTPEDLLTAEAILKGKPTV